MTNINTYTVCQLALNEKGDYSVANKQHMDSHDDMWNWVLSSYGRFASIRIVNDQTGEVREFTDNGENWERVL